MKIRSTAIATLLFAALGAAAPAGPSARVLFRAGNWRVERVTFSGGSTACVSQTRDAKAGFSIWAYPDQTVKLRFFSASWRFGDTGATADIEITIDSRPKWTLSGAGLYKSSILFTLPDSEASVDLLNAIAAGSRLHMRASGGKEDIRYSLAGSSASMARLISCANAIAHRSNPVR